MHVCRPDCLLLLAVRRPRNPAGKCPRSESLRLPYPLQSQSPRGLGQLTFDLC